MMYQVTLETMKKGNSQKEKQTFVLGEADTSEYAAAMENLADILFGLDIDFDDAAGEGDIMIDDILISISEEEEFKRKIAGRKCTYIVQGQTI